MAQKLENLINKDLLAGYDDELKKTYLAGGIVFDISAHKATGSPAVPATFASLAAALGTNGANIPQNMRKGGMTVKFIKGSAQSQSNKYVQCRLKAQTFSTSEADWECIEDAVSALEAAVGTGGSIDERIAAEGARHYLKAETYTKTEVNSLVTTPNVEYVTVTATQQTTAATDVLPATGSTDTIYRIANWGGSQYDTTAYCEYAWNGSAYVLLSVHSVQAGVPIVLQSSSTALIEPNKYNLWATPIATLEISFAAGISGYVNEYMFQFTCPSSAATTLTLPGTIRWANDDELEPEAGYTYQVSVVDNLAVYAGWEAQSNA